MGTVPLEHIAHPESWKLPSRGYVAMSSLIVAESAIFTIFVTAYLYYLGRDIAGPTPREVLELPIFGTVCLLSSSGFIMLAERAILINWTDTAYQTFREGVPKSKRIS